MAEENQDMGMEEILSSIKDILENDEPTNVNGDATQSEPVITEQADLSAADDDIIELSPNMRIEENSSEDISLSENVSLNEEAHEENIVDEVQADTITVDGNISIDDVLVDTENNNDDSILNQTDIADDSINIETDNLNEDITFDDTSLEDVSVDDFNIESFDEMSDDNINEVSLEDELAEDISSISQEAEINIEEENADSDFSLDDIINQDGVAEETDNVNVEDFNIDVPQIEEANIDEPVAENNNIVEELDFSEAETASYSESEVSIDEPSLDYSVAEEHTSEKVADISANIISNFAKMFSREEKAEPIAKAKTQEDIKPMVGSQSLENFVFEIIKNGITNEMNAQLNSSEFKVLINSEVNRQVASWINDNLPTLVEKVVKREIERVVAKAGV